MSDTRKLLIEYTSIIQEERPKLIESITHNDGRMILRNVKLQHADKPNRNSRIYPKSILEKQLDVYQNKILEKRAFGEADHPESNIINLKNVCQVILDARWKGNEIYGDVEILKTPSGNIIREILLAGCRIGQSSRGLGSVKQLYESDDPELVEVQDDFEFVTLADAVSDESTYGANMILMKESKGSVQVIKYKKTNELIHDLICELSGNCCLKQ